MNQASQQYQAEIEAKAKEAEALYKDYQKTASSLSAAQKSQKEEAIIAKEKEAAELRKNTLVRKEKWLKATSAD